MVEALRDCERCGIAYPVNALRYGVGLHGVCSGCDPRPVPSKGDAVFWCRSCEETNRAQGPAGFDVQVAQPCRVHRRTETRPGKIAGFDRDTLTTSRVTLVCKRCKRAFDIDGTPTGALLAIEEAAAPRPIATESL